MSHFPASRRPAPDDGGDGARRLCPLRAVAHPLPPPHLLYCQILRSSLKFKTPVSGSVSVNPCSDRGFLRADAIPPYGGGSSPAADWEPASSWIPHHRILSNTHHPKTTKECQKSTDIRFSRNFNRLGRAFLKNFRLYTKHLE